MVEILHARKEEKKKEKKKMSTDFRKGNLKKDKIGKTYWIATETKGYPVFFQYKSRNFRKKDRDPSQSCTFSSSYIPPSPNSFFLGGGDNPRYLFEI